MNMAIVCNKFAWLHYQVEFIPHKGLISIKDSTLDVLSVCLGVFAFAGANVGCRQQRNIHSLQKM